MEKLNPMHAGGGRYISLSVLPADQVQQIATWLSDDFLSQVDASGQTYADCIAYDDYEFWYEHCYRADMMYLEEAL